MAKRADKFQEDTPRINHNAKARKEIIRNCAKELDRIEGEIKELQAEAATIRNEKIKGELGMKLADFAAIRRVYKLEGDDRATALDTMREVFEALCPGEQLDWVDAQQKGAGSAAAEVPAAA